MEELVRPLLDLRNLAPHEILINVIDIGLVTFLVYRLLLLVRGTRAWRILLGVLAFLILLVVSAQLKLNTLHWILDKATILGPVALVILFLPELRHAIEGIGRFTPLKILDGSGGEDRAEARTVEEIVSGVAELQQESTGALIVIEKTGNLDDFAANGVLLQARISATLLASIFYGENPLHDGAVIVRGDMILSAASRLPLSESQTIDSHVHMRHRAAVGISEVADAIAIVVSEERGSISVAKDGVLTRLKNTKELRDLLNEELRKMPKTTETKRTRRGKAQEGGDKPDRQTPTGEADVKEEVRSA